MHPVSIVGCGYTGLRLARRWLGTTRDVRGYAARDSSLEQIAATGAYPVRLDLDVPPPPLPVDGRLVYYSVPPAPTGERDSRLAQFLDSVTGQARRIVYLSTTGVYGDCHGSLVDENTDPRPLTARAVRRLAAETALRSWGDARGVAWCILRIPGIYGPGRLPLERLSRREPAIDPAQATPGNRIHVDDLVTACVAAGKEACAERRIYNVTDGTDDSLTGYLQRVARITGLAPPPFISRADAQKSFSATSWSFLAESRRVANHRLLNELGVSLAYGDLDAGIRASV